MNPQEIAQAAQELLSIYQSMTGEQKKKYGHLVNQAIQALEERASQPPSPPEEPQVQVQVPEIARNLWALSRGDPDVFRLYMQSYPNDQVNAIARNPAQFDAIMGQINDTQSIPPLGQAEGIQQAPLQSSNVYGFRYDPLKKRLTVRFHGGSIYRYESVPPIIFEMFRNGDSVARTNGHNRFGRWWRGKKPSLGAAVHQLLIAGRFPYSRVR